MASYVLVALVGGVVGLGELLSRYRGSTGFVLRTYITYLYVGINVAASVAALILIRTFDWTFGVDGGSDAVRVTQVLVAGFGAMAFLRSALFVVRVGDADVPVGPGAFLTGLAETADAALTRRVDINEIAIRSEFAQLARRLSFVKAESTLPLYALALKRDVTPDDQARIAREVEQLRMAANLPDQSKVVVLGLAIMELVGPEVFALAIELAGNELDAEEASHDD